MAMIETSPLGRGRRFDTRWLEAHLTCTLVAVTASTLFALCVEGSPRIPALDWGARMPFGMRTLSVAILASVVMTLPVGGLILLPNLLCQWIAHRLGGHVALHAVMGMPPALLATAAMFAAGDVPIASVPPAAFATNAACGALGGLVFGHLLARRHVTHEAVPI